MAYKTKISDELITRIHAEWKMGCSIYKLKTTFQLSEKQVLKILEDLYSVRNCKDLDLENGPYQLIDLKDYHPITRAKISQIILNEPADHKDHNWRSELDYF